jgi:hypothetical protein
MDNGLQKYNTGAKMNQWSKRVAVCRNSGMTIKAWCAQEGVSEKTYYYWQRKIFKAAQNQMAEFIEVTGSLPSGKAFVATINVNGYSIEIHSGADKETLKALLEAVRSC